MHYVFHTTRHSIYVAALLVITCIKPAELNFDPLAPGQLPETINLQLIGPYTQYYLQHVPHIHPVQAVQLAMAEQLLPECPAYLQRVGGYAATGSPFPENVYRAMADTVMHPDFTVPMTAAGRYRFARAWQYASQIPMPVEFWIDIDNAVQNDFMAPDAVLEALTTHARSVVPDRHFAHQQERDIFIHRAQRLAPYQPPLLWQLTNVYLANTCKRNPMLAILKSLFDIEFPPQDGAEESQ